MELVLRPLRALRQGHRRDALALARRNKLKERLPLLSDTVTYEEFERACAHMSALHARAAVLPGVPGAKFGRVTARPRGLSHLRCGRRCRLLRVWRRLPVQSRPASLLERIVRLELQWPPGEDSPAAAPRGAHPSWSRAVQAGQLSAARDLTIETLTEFDPRQCRYRDGRWTQ